MTFDVNATGDTIRAVATALGRARLFDDRLGGSDSGRIAAWAEAVEPHALSQPDMLQAVTAYYAEESGKSMQVADLIRYGRRIRAERGQRETDEAREARQAELDAVKPAPEQAAEVVSGMVLGRVAKRTPRLDAAEDALQCVTGQADAVPAIREFFAAKREAISKGGSR